MKRSGFKVQRPPGSRPPRVAKQIGPEYTLRPRSIAAAATPMPEATPMPKDGAIQHQGYMAAVRKLACYRCGVSGLTQFCHADEGKGLALKTDCRLGWPGCGPDFMGNAGCHWLIGTSGQLGKEARREFEREAGAATREAIRTMGQWPATLPAWADDEVMA